MERGLAAAAGGGSKPVRPPEGFAARMFDYTSSDHEPKETKPARESRPQAVTGKPNDDSDASFKLAHSEDLLKRAQQAEERGKLKVAALYYKSVVSLGVSPNATVAKQRLAAIESKLASR
jgi:hypothetical protein